MSRKRFLCIGIFFILGVLFFVSSSGKLNFSRSNLTHDELCLLLPNGPVNSKLVKGWIDAAEAEGLHLVPMRIDQFLRPTFFKSKKYAGIILPDQLYRQISTSTVAQLKYFVRAGGHLMLVYDAGMLVPNQVWYPQGQDLFSGWTGIKMDRNKDLQNYKIKRSYVGNTPDFLEKLGVPFGKFMPIQSAGQKNFNAISTYGYGPIRYPHFRTLGPYRGQVLLRTADDTLIAGQSSYGLGQVLFINLPLTYLWSRTDSMLMRAFLRYFAQDILALPVLAATPKGIGGLILNIHVDSNAAFQPLEMMKTQGIFQHGPFSIHITAGPHCNYIGDKEGFNVENSANSQNWVKFFQLHGHEVGSHGGYIHNYFGLNANENNAAQFAPYLSMNDKALAHVLGSSITAYSAPVGNHPSWTTRYLEANRFDGYYTTSHMGTGPIHNYINGRFDAENLYAFPALPLGRYATFEEFAKYGLPQELVKKWLLRSLNFVSEKHELRLIYFHPPGLEGTEDHRWPNYCRTFFNFLEQAKKLMHQNKFQWYTMHDASIFLNHRKEVTWRVENTTKKTIIWATHSNNLKDQAWFLRKDRYLKPNIETGSGMIKEDNRHWIVVAGTGPVLKFNARFKI